MAAYVTLDGFIVRRLTSSGKAVGLVREGAGFQAELIWVPVSCCRDGERLTVGDTDIEVMEFIAIEKGLEY